MRAFSGGDMKILFVASELYPFAKTGGLADVVAALTNELCKLGHDVKLVLPGYPALKKELTSMSESRTTVNIGNILNYNLVYGKLSSTDADIILVDSDRLYQKTKIYGGSHHQLFLKFFALSHAAAKIANGEYDQDWVPDTLHANDWHAGLSFRILEHLGNRSVNRVFSIHNIAFSGCFPDSYFDQVCEHTGPLSSSLYTKIREFSFLEEAIRTADKINTVSPNYANEIQAERFGFGFQRILKERKRDLSGILNGVDYSIWHPEQDRFLPIQNFRFSVKERRNMKRFVQNRYSLPTDDSKILCSFTNRMTHQKMVDIIIDTLKRHDLQDFQFVFHGEGESKFTTALRALSARENISYIPGFEEEIEHHLLAAADICLSPSRFEPCGLNALYAMRCGALPLVRPVGGYRDTIIDEFEAKNKSSGNGFYLPAESSTALAHSLNRIRSIYRNPDYWETLVRNATNSCFSWSDSAKHYLGLYNLARRKRNTLRNVDQPSKSQHQLNNRMIAS